MNAKDTTLDAEALSYHSEPRPGKIGIVPTKPHTTQHDLALAYSPGVAAPSRAIAAAPDDIYRYTGRGNLVAVISNGTAVLGLGNIGAAAAKPVMEGKAMLFKTFAGLDSFDIEVDTTDPDDFVRTVRNIAVTFGGINLEDIKAPECFEIEARLRRELDIPVMHDDQHGTAIIAAAALMNAARIAGKQTTALRVVINGAGAAAIASARLFLKLGIPAQNLILCDSKGVVSTYRTDLNPMKREFATSRRITTLAEALLDADVFMGVSAPGVLTSAMLRTMAQNPIVLALANPVPEISYEEALASRPDIIFATGRSDYPNQVNNVLGFPYIFRAALDVRASEINDEMKLAASRALAELAREEVPEQVLKAYGINHLEFGRGYFIPKPLDPRLLVRVSTAVARAAMESGVARKPVTDWKAYESNAFDIVPHAGIRYAQIDVDDYREMDGESFDVLEMPVGVAFNGKFEVAGMKFVPTLDFTVVPQIGDTEVHPLNGDTLDVLNNTYNTTLGISAEYGDFTFGVAAKYGFGTDDRSNAGVKVNATYAF